MEKMKSFVCFGSSSRRRSNSGKESQPTVSDENRLTLRRDGRFMCFGSSRRQRSNSGKKSQPTVSDGNRLTLPRDGLEQISPNTHAFAFQELEAATMNFRPQNLVGEGGFGHVYQGYLHSTGQVVAVKQLDRERLQGNREFLTEVLMLSRLDHPNLVKLLGYCAEGDHRLLVYEFMPLRALDDHLFALPQNQEGLDWNTRMKIAEGAAKGLAYLHNEANPPVIYRDFKAANILLDEGLHPKLSDFGLAKHGPTEDQTYVSTRIMGTYGYCDPDYALTGQLTVKSDVWSFGVVFLELITGRESIDNTRPSEERNLVEWARTLYTNRQNFVRLADPRLKGRFPEREFQKALDLAFRCLEQQQDRRPFIAEVVEVTSYLANQAYYPRRELIEGSSRRRFDQEGSETAWIYGGRYRPKRRESEQGTSGRKSF